MSGVENKLELPPAEKRALLAELLRKKGAKSRQVPLSFAQQRLWFLDQLDPGGASYNFSRAVRLKGSLNLQALREALNAIVARHESLRTNFASVEGEPLQIIVTSREIELQLLDLRGLPQGERESEARRLASEVSRRAFNLAEDDLLRAGLIRLDDQDQVLLLVMHHIVSDGWSMGVLFRELSALYEAFSHSRPSPLPELPIQYADFARWQRDCLQGQALEEQVSYWKEHLAGAPAMLELPTDRPRPAIQTFSGGYQMSAVGKELTKSLNELSHREGVTLFMTLLAAFQTLLYRYANLKEIVVGTPIANRTRKETEGLIGFFVNTLVMRTDLSGEPSFRELLGRVREIALDAFAHQDLPFEKLVEELQPERSLGHMPLFQVLFALQNVPKSALELAALDLTDFAFAKRTSKLDLSLYVGERAEGLTLSFEYSTDLFDAATIERMSAHFQTLLEGIVGNPDLCIADLPLLTKAEREQLLVDWNDTQTDFPRECIHKLFERQVERRPNSVAVITETGQLTFAELDRRANQLAHYLQKLGVAPGEIVGLCVERSREMLVGVLGILKAGAAYLPLDPAYPHERLSFMLEDGGAKVLLTQEHLQENLPLHRAETIIIDKNWEAIARESEDSPGIAGTPENLAYVMYTSGSTGRPKGLGVTHRGVVRLVKETNYAQFGPQEVFLQFAPLSFDASTFEIWGSLLNGGRLVVMPPGLVSLTKLGEDVKRHGVTTLWLTAGLFQQMVETELESLRGVRQLLAGGDALSVPHLEQAARELKGCQLINGYGPTENTTFTCCYRVKPGERFAGSVPIGFPISNTQVYILDDELEPVPIGVVGELYAGGAGLAFGYLNDSALTAQRFVPHPFSEDLGARLYRTGDQARYRADGSIEFLGRIDHQVKLRGHRIELGEIETALRQSPAVQDAVVMMRHLAQGNQHLVGYVVADSNHPEFHIASELKALLKKTLPDYMVPPYFVFLEKFPLTPSGKIDRGALPLPDGARPDLEEVHIAPRDDLERRLANIWERLLGVQSVGIRDNFFDLGGHSLLAVRLVSEIEKEVGQRLPLVSFFQDASIEYLASLLRQDVSSLSWPTLVEIQAGGPSPPLFCVSMPNVNALGYRSLARYLGTNQPVFGLQAQYPEDLEGEHSQAAVNRIATEYLEALRAVRPKGPYQLIGLCRGAHIAYEMARRLEREGQEIALLGIIDTWVMENTYNYFWHLEYYARRLASLTLFGLRKAISFIKKMPQSAVTKTENKTSTLVSADSADYKQKTMEVYFPGPDFVPTTYKGRITVFRARRQPFNRIRDAHLGWGRLASGGVDLHFIPGGHSSVLKEPHVQGLAAELNKCLQEQSDHTSLKSRSPKRLAELSILLATLIEYLPPLMD